MPGKQTPEALGRLDDGTVDIVVRELTEHIKKLETKRLQLIHQRDSDLKRSELLALVGKDTKAADEILLILEQFSRVPDLLRLALTGGASVARSAQLAAAVEGISTEAINRDLHELSEWIATMTREDLGNHLRRWRRTRLAEEGDT